MSRLDTRARELVDLKDQMNADRIKAENSEKAYREAERDLWLDLEEEFGKVSTVTLDLGEDYGEVQLQRRETITATVYNEAELVAALREEGLEEAYDEDVPKLRKKVLNQIARNRAKSGQGLPKGLDFHPRRYIAVSKKGDSS